VIGVFGGTMVVGLSGAGIATQAGSVIWVGASLVVMGVGLGVWDVAMNLAGTDVERALHRAVMPHFHAGYSLGTAAAAGAGMVVARFGVSPLVHFGTVAAATAVCLGCTCRCLLAGEGTASSRDDPRKERKRGTGWRQAVCTWTEGRTLLIGAMVLSLGLAEGAAGDWLASGLVQSFDVGESAGIAGLALYLCAMTAMRVFGTGLIDRLGRVRALRLTAALALVGLAMYGLAPWLPLALAGSAVWGLGSALGFPVGMSAAGDDPLRAAQRTSVVATVAYGAFLVGPPVLGLVADVIGFRFALLTVLVPVTFSLVIAPIAGPPGGSRR
jgi:hypothetical protein